MSSCPVPIAGHFRIIHCTLWGGSSMDKSSCPYLRSCFLWSFLCSIFRLANYRRRARATNPWPTGLSRFLDSCILWCLLQSANLLWRSLCTLRMRRLLDRSVFLLRLVVHWYSSLYTCSLRAGKFQNHALCRRTKIPCKLHHPSKSVFLLLAVDQPWRSLYTRSDAQPRHMGRWGCLRPQTYCRRNSLDNMLRLIISDFLSLAGHACL